MRSVASMQPLDPYRKSAQGPGGRQRRTRNMSVAPAGLHALTE